MRITTADGSSSIELALEPRVTFPKAGGVSHPVFACDRDSRRIFYGDGVLGYIAALDHEGRELWRAELPGFRSVVEQIAAMPNPTPPLILELFDREGSIVTALTVSPPYLAAEYRTADRYYHAIFHRSGTMIAVLGPWNAVLKESVTGGWVLRMTEDATPGAYFFPDREVSVVVEDPRPALLEDHLLAAVTPVSDQGQSTWSLCAGPISLGEVLGTRWQRDLATLAIEVRAQLGPEWLQSVVMRVGATPPREVRRALLSAGVDVEMTIVAEKGAAVPP